MIKDEVVQLGIASQSAKEKFHLLGHENTATDPEKRQRQIERYERARADMHEAMNQHNAALEKLGTAPRS